jgi:inner membrane protein
VDNVTHTLAGLVAARAALYLRDRRAPAGGPTALPFATLTASAFANNAPDLDFLYRSITPGKLGYLLHHRGHTHTLLATPALALLCLALVAGLLRLRGQRLSRPEWGFLLGVCIAGGFLHVAMDFGNNYGVHPFWPLDDHWYYGDAIFIVDPWLMIALGGILFGSTRSRVGRSLIGLILAGLALIAWAMALGAQPRGPSSPPVSGALALALSIAAAAWLAWMRWGSARARRWSGASSLLLLLVVQLSARGAVRAAVRAGLAGSLELVSLATTPLPGNPLCWSVLAAGVAGAEPSRRYLVQHALASAWPALWPASACGAPLVRATAPLVEPATPLPAVAGVAWGRQFRAPLAELHDLTHDCVASAFLRFARIPFWLRDGARATLVGDARFDRSPALDFTDLPLEAGAECPPNVPPWEPPLEIPPLANARRGR